jgi:hypothetical protein
MTPGRGDEKKNLPLPGTEIQSSGPIPVSLVTAFCGPVSCGIVGEEMAKGTVYREVLVPLDVVIYFPQTHFLVGCCFMKRPH